MDTYSSHHYALYAHGPCNTVRRENPVFPSLLYVFFAVREGYRDITFVKRSIRTSYIVLAAVLLLAVLAATLMRSFFTHSSGVTAGSPSQKTVVGHAFFISSGLLAQNSNQGITDRVQIDLRGLPPSQTGKSYYAWLLADTDTDASATALPLLLGVLSLKNGHAALSFQGDQQNSNLLNSYSRFLVTEEDANTTPNSPSLDTATWRYYAAFSRTPNLEDTANHFSMLDHLRHLLSQDPKIKAVGLVGGLDTWLFRNTLKTVEWSGSARDAYSSGDVGLMRRQLVRLLDYLDGSQFVQTENLPPDLAPLLVDPVIARVGLLEISPTQTPPGYLKHIGNHLRELVQSPGVTPGQKQLAININQAINYVQAHFIAVHNDAAKLIRMTPDQLKQPDVLNTLNDMFVQANTAFVGQTDPDTHQVKGGVAQVHYDIQRLATFDVTTCTTGNTTNPCL